jgi:hypothetical protein
VLWLDAYVENVDRSWRNPNLLMWHRELWLIDHGASLYFHHNWPRAAAAVQRPYRAEDHVLAPYATQLAQANADFAPRVTEELLGEVLARVPDSWLVDSEFDHPDKAREAYLKHLTARMADTGAWLPKVGAK